MLAHAHARAGLLLSASVMAVRLWTCVAPSCRLVRHCGGKLLAAEVSSTSWAKKCTSSLAPSGSMRPCSKAALQGTASMAPATGPRSSDGTPGELQVFKWLRDKPPALTAAATQDAVTGETVLNGYNRSCKLHADTFADIWCCEDAPPCSWHAKIGEAGWIPDPGTLNGPGQVSSVRHEFWLGCHPSSTGGSPFGHTSL